MAYFKLEIAGLLMREGGYSNSSTDLGGETKYGISKKQYPDLDIPSLTSEQASEIYRRDFWDKFRLSEIDNQKLAANVFDMIINMGYTPSIKCLQKALHEINTNVSFNMDGILGTLTIQMVNESDALEIIRALKLQRILGYLDIVKENRSQLANLEGWIKRTLSL
jgi:lysozyme family protein